MQQHSPAAAASPVGSKTNPQRHPHTQSTVPSESTSNALVPDTPGQDILQMFSVHALTVQSSLSSMRRAYFNEWVVLMLQNIHRTVKRRRSKLKMITSVCGRRKRKLE